METKVEPFAGRLSGTKFTYEYSDGGRLMAGKVYYLQADKRDIYVLRFAARENCWRACGARRIQSRAASACVEEVNC